MNFVIFILTLILVSSYLIIGFEFASNLFDGEYKVRKLINKIILGILTIVFLPEVIILGLVFLITIAVIYCDDTLRK